jgi:agmatine/peptidylarginine deiminase
MPRLPAEWEPQSGILLTWPHADTDWAVQLQTVDRTWAEIAAAISRYEAVLICCRDPAHQQHARALALAAGADPARLHLARAASNDTWARDHGPIGVLDDTGRPRLLDFRFTGWGGKFAADRDDAITGTLHAGGAFGDTPLASVDLVLEGGAIETDGAGTLLAVERTLVDPHRNPGMTRGDIESVLARELGIGHFLWLASGQISGDDTDGHIDTLARFADPLTLCHATCEDPQDADHAALRAMESELRALRNAGGEPYRLVPLPTPRPVLDADGRRLPAGYANFLIIDGAVLVPIYDDPADGLALEIIGGLFPGRDVIGIDCRALIRQGGSLHCVTMQLPAGVPLIGAR